MVKVEGEKPRNIFQRPVVALTIILMVGLGVGFWAGERSSSRYLDYSELDEVYKIVAQRFDGEVNKAKMLEGAKRGMVEGLGDPYSQFFTRQDKEEFFDDLEGRFGGIGIEMTNKNGLLMIADVLADTPAEKAGLQVDDVIAKVDENETSTWSSAKAAKVIRGEEGTKVKIMVIRDGAAKEFEITRETISVPSVSWEVEDGVGILKISRFAEGDTTNLTRKAADEFVAQKVKGVVLDLRGNGGGYVKSAVDVASLWLTKNDLVVSEKSRGKVNRKEVAGDTNTLKGLPTVILLDGGSASASEIVAGALQDHGLPTVVGTKSYGKGSMQGTFTLSRNNSLHLTIAKWYTPNDRNIDREGIVPDEEVKFDKEAFGKGVDTQLSRALEILRK